MTIYLLAYTAMLILAGYQKKLGASKSVFCGFVFVIWTVIIGLRHPSMGHDLRYGLSFGYWGMYDVIGRSSWESVLEDIFMNYERGYVIYNKLLYYISDDAQILLFISAVITMAALTWLIYKYSKFPILSVIIYLALPVFMIAFSGIRQGVAIAITIFSFKFVKEKKLIPFVLIVLLASQFHASARIFLLAYPIYYVKTERAIQKLGSIFLLPVLYIFRAPLFNYLAGLIGENDTAIPSNAFGLFVFFVLIYIVCLFFEDVDNQEQIGYRNLFYTACVCQVFSSVSDIAMRMGYYFMVYLILLLPEVTYTRQQKKPEEKSTQQGFMTQNNSVIMNTAFLIFFVLWGINGIRTATWAQTNPHSFFWQ